MLYSDRRWRLNQIDFRIEGPQTLTVPGVQPLTVMADDGIGDVRLGGDGRLAAGTLSLDDLTVLLPALGDLKVESVEMAVAQRAEGTDRDGLAAFFQLRGDAGRQAS